MPRILQVQSNGYTAKKLLTSSGLLFNFTSVNVRQNEDSGLNVLVTVCCNFTEEYFL